MVKVQDEATMSRRRAAAGHTPEAVALHYLKAKPQRRLAISGRIGHDGRLGCKLFGVALEVCKGTHRRQPTAEAPNVRAVPKLTDGGCHFTPARLAAQTNPSLPQVVKQLLIRNVAAGAVEA